MKGKKCWKMERLFHSFELWFCQRIRNLLIEFLYFKYLFIFI